MLACLAVLAAFADRAELQAAVDAWLANATAAEEAHGPISDWDTSLVNSTAYLFMGAHAFNANLSGWDTSKVVTMQRMFHNAASFDGSARAVRAHQGDGGRGDAPERDVLLLRRRRDRVRACTLQGRCGSWEWAGDRETCE